MRSINDLDKIASSFSTTEKMPVLFLGHGSPMNAIEENQFVTGFRNLAQNLPKPNAILCVSAHWFTKGSKVTAMEMPKTIHDFGGFPKELFEVQYPAHGSPELATITQELLLPTVVELDHHWGLDHGAWSVIKHLYPKADIPVIQLSIDYSKPAEYHFQLAQQLSRLREKGILIIGSGNIIHNLRLVDFYNFEKDDYGYDWAIEARARINSLLLDGNFQPLLEYEKQSQAFQLAIPTPEHFLPMLYALALKTDDENVEFFNQGFVGGSLVMTSLKIG